MILGVPTYLPRYGWNPTKRGMKHPFHIHYLVHYPYHIHYLVKYNFLIQYTTLVHYPYHIIYLGKTTLKSFQYYIT